MANINKQLAILTLATINVNQNKLFQLTRWRLAGWYVGIMGLILSLCGFAVYRAIAHANWNALDRELESVAGTLHDSIEPTLKQPGRLEPITQKLLPDICLALNGCVTQLENTQRHAIGAIHQGDYYVRLLDRSGRLIAFAGLQPEGLYQTSKRELWQIHKDRQGTRYHQISLSLHTQDNRWGYIQVGRSLKDLDNQLAVLKFILLLGLPVAMILVGGSSWLLAGLAMQPIYQSYRQIQQFTADAAHELRTPLAAIQATVESSLRINKLSGKEARDTLITLERQNHRLSELVKDLLLLSRMDQQVSPIKLRLTCLNDLVSDVTEELAALAIASDVNLMADNGNVGEPLYVNGDEEQLYRLLCNLVINAIQYTPVGEEVMVTLESSDRTALIHIKDTGIGITAQQQKLIFNRFYRVNSDRSRNSGGSGLGLPIALAIATAHNGSIHVESKLGKGSTFTVKLPMHNSA